SAHGGAAQTARHVRAPALVYEVDGAGSVARRGLRDFGLFVYTACECTWRGCDPAAPQAASEGFLRASPGLRGARPGRLQPAGARALKIYSIIRTGRGVRGRCAAREAGTGTSPPGAWRPRRKYSSPFRGEFDASG